jgi:hypothetical protein
MAELKSLHGRPPGDLLRTTIARNAVPPITRDVKNGAPGTAMQPAASWPVALPVLKHLPPVLPTAGPADSPVLPLPAGAFPTPNAGGQVVVGVVAVTVHFRDGRLASFTLAVGVRVLVASFLLAGLGPVGSKIPPGVLPVFAGWCPSICRGGVR